MDRWKEHSTTFFMGAFADISTAEVLSFLATSDGLLTKIQVTLAAAITVADAEVIVKRADGTVLGTLVIPFTGSGENVKAELEITNDNDLAEGELLTVETDGGSTGAVVAAFAVWMYRD